MLSTSSTSQRLFLILAALVIAAIAGNSVTRLRADEPPPTDSSTSLHDLEQQHIATLRQIVTLATQLRKTGSGISEDVEHANRQLIDAELEYASTAQERIQILTDTVNAAKEDEKTTDAMVKIGTATPMWGLEMTAYRLDLEVRLAREKAK